MTGVVTILTQDAAGNEQPFSPPGQPNRHGTKRTDMLIGNYGLKIHLFLDFRRPLQIFFLQYYFAKTMPKFIFSSFFPCFPLNNPSGGPPCPREVGAFLLSIDLPVLTPKRPNAQKAIVAGKNF
jgi:hypothetical protein